jgi:putative ABC transport system substrate-binding protein
VRVSVFLRVSAACALVAAGIVAAPVQAQEAPVLANDGMSLARETPATQTMFAGVFGARAATQWVAEHEAALSVGAPDKRVRVAFMAQGNGIGDAAETQRAAFIDSWRAAGYQPGRNLLIGWYYPPSPTQPLDGMAAELVSKNPDLIITNSTPPAQAVKKATSTIPFIFSASGDPLGAGIVTNLEHPGGNITGVLTLPLSANQINVDLLREVLPSFKRLAVIRSSNNPLPGVFDSIRAAGELRGISVQSIMIQNIPADIPAAVDAAAAGGADAMLQVPDASFTAANYKQIAELAIQKRIPYFAANRAGVVDGALITTAAGNNQPIRMAVAMAARVLKGERPGDIPVAAPEVSLLIVNMKTARAIGLAVPPAVVARATEVLQ